MSVRNTSSHARVDLHRNFGDAAVGKTQGRRLAVKPSGEKRTNLSGIGKSFVRQGARALNVLIPEGQRADAKVREALRDCSHRAGDLVGSLVSAGTTTLSLVTLTQQLDRCQETARAVSKLDPTLNCDVVFRARLDVHLRNLTPRQLIDFKQGIDQIFADASGAQAIHGLSSLLAELRGAASNELSRRAVDAAGQLVDQLTNTDKRLGEASFDASLRKLIDAEADCAKAGVPSTAIASLTPRIEQLNTLQLQTLNNRLRAQISKAPAGTLRHAALEPYQACAVKEGTRRASAEINSLLKQMHPRLQAAIKEAEGDDMQEVDYQFSPLYGKAYEHLDKFGLLNTHEACTPYVKAALVHYLVGGPASESATRHENVARLIGMLPSSEQHALGSATAADIGLQSGDVAQLDSLITNSVGQRLASSQQNFTAALTELNQLIAGPAAEMDDDAWIVQLSQALDTTVSTMQFLRKHIQSNELDEPVITQQIDTALVTLRTQLTNAIDQRGIPLRALDDRGLLALYKGLKAIELEAATGPILDAISDRKAAAKQAYGEAVKHALGCLAEGEYRLALLALQDVERLGTQALDVHSDLGESLDDEDKKFKFRTELGAAAVKSLSKQDHQLVLDAISSPDTLAMRAALRSAGHSLLADIRLQDDIAMKDLGKAMAGIDVTMAVLTKSVEDATGHAIEGEEADTVFMSIPASEALLTVFGIREYTWNSYQTPRVLPPTQQKLFRDWFDGQYAAPSQGTGGAFGMPEQFIKDIKRSTYLLQKADGSYAPLVPDKAALKDTSPTRQAGLQAASRTVADFAGNAAQHKTLMEVAVQTSLAGFVAILQDPDSPATLDGQPGLLGTDPEKTHTTYVIRHDDQGNLLVRCDFDILGGEATFHPRDGDEYVELDPDRSGARLTVELIIDAKGEVDLHAPVAYSGQFHRKEA